MSWENESVDLMHLRLMSPRRKKRLKRQDFDKKLIRLYREERAISRRIWNLGYEELKPPVQRGWKRYFVLRDDVSRSEHARLFQGILDKINTVQYSWRRDFKVKHRQRGKKNYVVRTHELERLNESCLKRKKLTSEEMQYFHVQRLPACKPGGDRWLYTFREPWRFRLKIEPHMIKRKRIRDYDLEQRANEIRQYVDRNHLRPRMFRIVHGRHPWRLRYHCERELPKHKYHPLKNRSFADILNEHMPGYASPPQNPDLRISRVFFLCEADVTKSQVRRIKAPYHARRTRINAFSQNHHQLHEYTPAQAISPLLMASFTRLAAFFAPSF